ncbi:MAG: hypothetical protein R2764_03655 [Bacteroidales bacterium]
MNKSCNGSDKRIGNTETHFYASGLLDYNKIEMVFTGLDTYAEVYLNDTMLLFSNNMFREWVADCKELLTLGENHLHIKFCHLCSWTLFWLLWFHTPCLT